MKCHYKLTEGKWGKTIDNCFEDDAEADEDVITATNVKVVILDDIEKRKSPYEQKICNTDLTLTYSYERYTLTHIHMYALTKGNGNHIETVDMIVEYV